MNAPDFLREVERLGCEMLTDGERVGLRGPADAVGRLRPELSRLKAALLALLAEPRPRPYLDERGDLVVPFGTPPELCWWMPGGRSIGETLADLDAPEHVRTRYRHLH